jgi:DNA polymerase-3 subunit delta'
MLEVRKADRLPHAVLLNGPQGIGKQHFAQLFAQSLLCRVPNEQGFACGHCRDCHLFEAGSHPNLFDCQPSEPTAVIKIDQIRDLAKFCIQSGSVRVGFIAPAERLNQNAANALLKTLEEPPAGVILLLISSQLGRIPATLRSRCQKIQLARPAKPLALHWLNQQGYTDEAEILLGMAGGAPLLAQQLGAKQALADRQALFDIYKAVLEQSISEVAAAEQWLRYDREQSLNWLLSWHMDLIRLNTLDTAELDQPDLAQALRELADKLSSADCFRRYQSLLKLRQQLQTQRNASQLMEAFFTTCEEQ